MSPRHVPASVTELQRIGLFGSLPGETLRLLAERMTREEIPPRGPIAGEGRLSILLSGLAGTSGADSRRVLRPGEPFGEVACDLALGSAAAATALTVCVVASCDRGTFEELLRPWLPPGAQPGV